MGLRAVVYDISRRSNRTFVTIVFSSSGVSSFIDSKLLPANDKTVEFAKDGVLYEGTLHSTSGRSILLETDNTELSKIPEGTGLDFVYINDGSKQVFFCTTEELFNTPRKFVMGHNVSYHTPFCEGIGEMLQRESRASKSSLASSWINAMAEEYVDVDTDTAPKVRKVNAKSRIKITKQVKEDTMTVKKNTQDNPFEKMMERMFKQVSAAFDPFTGKCGIRTEDGIVTLGTNEDGSHFASVNPMDIGGFDIPAFAIRRPLAEIKEGDIFVFQNSELGFVVEKKGASLKVMRTSGSVSTINETKTQMMGQSGFLTVPSLAFGGEGNGMMGQMAQMALMQEMMNGEADMSEMMGKMMAMSMMGGFAGGEAPSPMGGMGNMFQSMMPMMMMKSFMK